MKLELFFPTPVYSHKVENAQKLNKHLFKKIKEWRRKSKGVKKTNRGGWHSTTDMHTREEFKPFVNELMQAQEAISKNEGYIYSMEIGNMWANINYPGNYNVAHLHPNSNWSGAYYVKVPKDSGLLHLTDPRHGANMIAPKQFPIKQLHPRLWKQFTFTPSDGALIIFPSYVTHDVLLNESKKRGEAGWRVSISFNLIQIPFLHGEKADN